MIGKRVTIKSFGTCISVLIRDKISVRCSNSGIAVDCYLVEDEKGNVLQIDPKSIIKIS